MGPANIISNYIKLSKQGSSSTKESGSPGAKFSRSFPIWWGHSRQWRPLLPKEGGLIQMEISGHPPIPLAQNNYPLWQFPSYFSTVFWVLNFRGRFEALNDVFWRFGAKFPLASFGWPKVVKPRQTFPTSYRMPKSEIVCKRYDPRKWTVQLTTLGLQTLWRFIF